MLRFIFNQTFFSLFSKNPNGNLQLPGSRISFLLAREQSVNSAKAKFLAYLAVFTDRRPK
jgi:hypothetical protein